MKIRRRPNRHGFLLPSTRIELAIPPPCLPPVILLQRALRVPPDDPVFQRFTRVFCILVFHWHSILLGFQLHFVTKIIYIYYFWSRGVLIVPPVIVDSSSLWALWGRRSDLRLIFGGARVMSITIIIKSYIGTEWDTNTNCKTLLKI